MTLTSATLLLRIVGDRGGSSRADPSPFRNSRHPIRTIEYAVQPAVSQPSWPPLLHPRARSTAPESLRGYRR